MEHYFTNNENLKSEIRELPYTFNNTSFLFYSDLGVFSKNKIDYGSEILLTSFLKTEKHGTFLDVGCGYGFLGITISKITEMQGTLIDINKRAVHLTERNIKENKVNATSFISDVYKEIKEKYDYIITNPPIRAGKEKVLEILTSAKEHLNKNGELWYVIRKDQGAKSINKIMENYYNVEIITKSKGYYVMRSKM